MRLIRQNADPADLILCDLPAAFGGANQGQVYHNTVRTLRRVRDEVGGLIDGYIDVAANVIAETLSVDSEGDPLHRMGSWIHCLDVDCLLAGSDLRISDKALLRTTRDALNGLHSREDLSRSLSSILLQCSIDQWHDSTVNQFRLLLREGRQRIEDAALAAQAHERMVPLVRARISALEQMLQRMQRGTSLLPIRRAKEHP